MWLVQHITTRSRELDFTSSGQARCRTEALFADGIEIVNAMTLVSTQLSSYQAMVCEACGTPQCNPGGWISQRRLGDTLILMPAFELMRRGAWDQNEYAPPHYIDHRGSLLVRVPLDTSNHACEFFRRPPNVAVSGSEIVAILQWEAPLGTLARFPSPPSLLRENVLTTSHGKGDEAVAALRELLHVLQDAVSVELDSFADAEPVTFYLGPDGYSEWQPLLYHGDTYHLSIAPGLAVRPATVFGRS